MSDQQEKSHLFGNRFSGLGATIRQSAHDMTARAQAQVSEINAKLNEATPNKTENGETPATPDFNNAEKKDLLELLQKMNKKVKALTVIRQQLATKVEQAENEKSSLLNLITDEILNGVQVSGDDVVPQLRKAWQEQDEQNNLTLQQLQREFQKIQHPAPNGDWENEKKELIAKHEEELAKVKSEASQVSSSSDNQDEIQRIKDAAAAQLQAFKKKVAAARNAEITKVKTETAASAKKIMEAKLLEQKQKFEEHLKTVKEGLSAASFDDTAKNEVIENLQQQVKSAKESESKSLKQQQLQFEERIDSMKQQLVAAQNDLSETTFSNDLEIEKLRQELNAVKDSEAKKLENQKQAFEEQLSHTRQRLASQSDLNDLIAAKESEVSTLRQELTQRDASETAKLQSQQQAFEQHIQSLKEHLAAYNGIQEALVAKDAEIDKIKQDFLSKRDSEIKVLQEGFAKEKEQIQIDFEQKLKAFADKNQAMLEEQKAVAVQKVTSEFDDKLEKLRCDLEQSKVEAVEKVLVEAQLQKIQDIESVKAASAAELEKLKASVSSQVQSLEKQLQERESSTRAAQERELLLVGELDEVKSLLSSARNGQESSAQAIDEALATQRASFEERLASKDKESKDISESLTKRIEAVEKERDDVKSSSLAEIENLRRAADVAKQEIDTLHSRLSSDDAAKKSLQAEQESNIKQLTVKLADKEEHSIRTSKALREAEERLASARAKCSELESSLKVVHEQAKAQGDNSDATQRAVQKLQGEHNKALEDLRVSLEDRHRQELQKQLDLSAVKVAAENDARLQELTASYQKRLDDTSNAAQALLIEKEAHAHAQQSLAEEFKSKFASLQEENASLEKSLLEAKAMLENAAQADSSEKDAALSEVETRCADAEKSLAELAFELAETRTKLKETEKKLETSIASSSEELKEKFSAQISRLEEEKAELSKMLVTNKEAFEEEQKKMRETMEQHIDKMTSQFKEKLEAVRKANSEEMATAKKASQERDEKMVKLVERLKALTATSTKLRDDNEELKKKLAAEANSQKALHEKLGSLQRQLDETVTNSSETAASLLKQQEDLEQEKSSLESRAKQLQSELQVKANKVEELTGKLQALSGNLNALTEDHRLKEEKLEHASKLEAKLRSSESEVSELREQVNTLKLEKTKADTVMEKLQAEKETNERNKGERTALVGMLETQLSEMNDKLSDTNAKLEAANYDLDQKNDDLNRKEMEIASLKTAVEESQNSAKRTAESLAAAQKGADSKSSKMVEALQKELQATKQQMARKSAAAQKLLQQRESECAELRKTNKALQTEVDKGSYSDRKIFELAEQQCNRESAQASEIEMREAVIDRMRQALLERDGDLASAEKKAHEVELQLEELFRIRRRDDVNIDYLKGIVVKYLSLPPGSSERAGLLPVLATLLQFDGADYKTIEEGKNKVSWWGSSVVPTMINSPSATARPATATTGSAEVSVSSGPPPDSSRRTSLQF